MLKLLTVEDESLQAWQEYVHNKPDAHFYHDYRWKTVLGGSFGHKPFYLLAQDGSRISGAFPLIFMKSKIMRPCLISLPFLNYGGMLADNKEAEAFLLNSAINIANSIKAVYIESRDLNSSSIYTATREHKVTMLLYLNNDIEAAWSGLDHKVRNEIRKAQKSGIEIKAGKAEMLSCFYEVFCRNMRDLGTPVLGRRFFESIIKEFPEEANIFVAELNGRAIASAFTLCHGDTMEVPWASSIRDFNKLCPNEFLYWEMIKYATLQKLKIFDFGRCTKDSGTYKFKKQWNAEAKQLYWHYWAYSGKELPADNPKKSGFSPLIYLWKKLPLAVANKFGPHISRDITTF